MRILGLDEAGRGCVLGPLVVGGFLFEHVGDSVVGDSHTPTLALQLPLRAAGADDSKALSARRREHAQSALAALGAAHTRSISPARIDEGNLNTLEIEAFLDIVRETSPDHVFLDAPVNPRGIPKLKADLVRRSGVQGWTIEPKADSTWPVVGAASIFAKVLRDEAITALNQCYADVGGVGSGYPSDPVTRAWLMRFIQRGATMPDCVRTRWGTLDNLRQTSLFGS